MYLFCGHVYGYGIVSRVFCVLVYVSVYVYVLFYPRVETSKVPRNHRHAGCVQEAGPRPGTPMLLRPGFCLSKNSSFLFLYFILFLPRFHSAVCYVFFSHLNLTTTAAVPKGSNFPQKNNPIKNSFPQPNISRENTQSTILLNPLSQNFFPRDLLGSETRDPRQEVF